VRRLKTGEHTFIFYHIPEIDDPFPAFGARTAEDKDKLAKREIDRGELGKDFPYSAWTVRPNVRTMWNEVVKNKDVKGLFAGHFHYPRRQIYQGFGWVQGSTYLSGSLTKLLVCPPVASKRQGDAPVQARGFREVSIDCGSGKINSTIFWYEKNRGPQPQLVEKELALSVDPATNTASGLIHLSNPTEKEISLSLSAGDFRSQTTGYGMSSKVLFTAPQQTTGQQVYEAKLAAGATAAVKIDVSNFLEAGEATTLLCNYGEPIGTVHAMKWRPAFAVKIVVPTPDKPEFNFTQGQPRQITLKNDDAMTYQVAVAAEVDGIWSAPSRVTLTPNSSASLELKPRDEWFPPSAAIRETIRDGTIRIQWPASESGGRPPLAERIVAFKAHLNSGGEFRQTFWGYLFVIAFLTFGGVCSMLLSNWVPNRLSRADVEEQLNDLANRTRDLSTKIDSGLRVFLRVERNRLYRLLRSRWIFSANFPDIVKECSDKLAVLSKQIDLATQLDRARLHLAGAFERNPIAAKIEVVDCELQEAADLLCRSEPTTEDLDAAQAFIVGAVDKISKMDETDSQFAANLLARIALLKTYLDPGAQTAALAKLKELCPTPFTVFDTFSAATVPLPEQYSEVDRVTAQLLVIRDYQAYYNANKLPPFPEQDECVKHLQTDTIAGLRRARLVLKQIREGIFVRNVVEAIQDGKVEILVEPPPVEDRLTKFSIRFDSDKLNTAAAREEVRCEWDFGHDGLTETGWEAFHYFPKVKRRLFSKAKSGPYDVCASFVQNGNGIAVGPDKKPSLQKRIAVREALGTSSADRNLAEFVRLAIALTIALIGLLAGAREQLVKLDLIPAAVAVFLLGFGADTIKNLISPKQTQK